MMWSIVLTAFGLFFVIEGLLPALSPRIWRWMMQQMFIQSDRVVHIIGLVSMLIGLALVIIARDLY